MLSQTRYHKKWKSKNGLKKWKFGEMIAELMDIVPEKLCVLIDLLMDLEYLPYDEMPDYRKMTQKVRIEL